MTACLTVQVRQIRGFLPPEGLTELWLTFSYISPYLRPLIPPPFEIVPPLRRVDGRWGRLQATVSFAIILILTIEMTLRQETAMTVAMMMIIIVVSITTWYLYHHQHRATNHCAAVIAGIMARPKKLAWRPTASSYSSGFKCAWHLSRV